MPNASMVTAPKAEPDPAETLTPHHLPVQSPAQRSSASRNGRAAGQGRRRVPRCAGGRIGGHVPRPPPPSLAPGPGTSPDGGGSGACLPRARPAPRPGGVADARPGRRPVAGLPDDERAVAAPDQLPITGAPGSSPATSSPPDVCASATRSRSSSPTAPASVCGRTHCRFRRLPPGRCPARAAAQVPSMSGTVAWSATAKTPLALASLNR